GSEVKTSPPADCFATAEKTVSNSFSVLAPRTSRLTPSISAAEWSFSNCDLAVGLVGLTATANLAAVGSNSCIISSRFGDTSTLKLETPVILPPGRGKLSTTPNWTVSPPISNTIALLEVAAFAASATGAPPGATMTSTLWSTNAAASDGNCLYCP